MEGGDRAPTIKGGENVINSLLGGQSLIPHPPVSAVERFEGCRGARGMSWLWRDVAVLEGCRGSGGASWRIRDVVALEGMSGS